MAPQSEQKVAQIIVDSLYNAGVRVVFGIPGAKVDAVFDTLSDHPEIKLIVCRHEQNAAFMAAATGRITGVPGVCIATSGPGAGNLTTGLVTATTEGDPVVAIVGSVPRMLNTKHTHQSMKALDILGPTSKSAMNIDVEDVAAEIILAAFRTTTTSPKGSAVINLPMDIAAGKSKITAFQPSAFKAPLYGPAPAESIRKVARMLESAKRPVLFLGQRASSHIVVEALHEFLAKHKVAVVETFQAAGAISEELAPSVFFGRVGLFRNQIGDRLLQNSDCIITLGYDPTEYEATAWNPSSTLPIVHVDYTSCEFGAHYHPDTELLGSVRETIRALAAEVSHVNSPDKDEFCQRLQQDAKDQIKSMQATETAPGARVHPLQFVAALQARVSPSTTVTCDVGTVYIYIMRHFRAYQPRRLLCSNGQQTLGVGMPWAIAASLSQSPPCSAKVVSLSGDGGFMFSAQELSTAVQQRCNITHFIWNDEAFNMVEFQEEMKYGRSSGIALGGVDFVKLAEAFGAKGFRVHDASELERVMEEALAYEGVALVDVRIDYSRAKDLAGNLLQDSVG
jgi:acetolactate synthase-1/2/3 large subunit